MEEPATTTEPVATTTQPVEKAKEPENLPEGVICTDDCPLIEAKIRETFPENPDLFIAIAKAESELNPTVPNWGDPHGGSHGLFQINGANILEGDTYTDLYDVDVNLAYARRIYETQGITAWGSYTDKRYLKYME